jgi:hypothetical protein
MYVREGPRASVQVVPAEEAAKALGQPLGGVRVFVWSDNEDLYKGYVDVIAKTDADGTTGHSDIRTVPVFMHPVFYFLCEGEGYVPVRGSFTGADVSKGSWGSMVILVYMQPVDGAASAAAAGGEGSGAAPGSQ